MTLETLLSAGSFRRIKDRLPYVANVEIEILPAVDGPFITVATDGSGWIAQGYIEEAGKNGYLSWKAGAVAGVEFALQVCGNPRYAVAIRKIEGMQTDTNPTVVAAAAADAVWKALGFQPPEEVTACIEQKVFSSWSLPLDAVAIFC